MDNNSNLLAMFPDSLKECATDSQDYINEFFKNIKTNEEEAKITIGDDRFVLLRAESLSKTFYNLIKKNYSELNDNESFKVASSILYDFAFNMGYSDALAFKEKTKAEDPFVVLSLGPTLFSKLAWGFVKIKEESEINPDGRWFLVYDHINTFESECWLKTGLSKNPVCFLSAGYSAGWISAASGIESKSEEILCKAKGDSECRFILAPNHSFADFKKKFKEKYPDLC